MQAVILCRNPLGFPGPMLTRRPVFLMPVGDKPVGQHMVEKLFESGVKNIVLAVPDSPFEVNAFFGDGSRFGENISRIPLKPGLKPLTYLPRLGRDLAENFIYFEGPVLTDANLHELYSEHLRKGSGFTWYGSEGLACLRLEDLSRIRYLGGLAELAEFYGERATVCPLNGARVLAMEDLNAYYEANKAWLKGESPFPPRATPLAQAGRGCEIHPSAKLSPPYYLGPYCSVGKNVLLGPDAVIGQGSILDDGSESYDCVICDGTYLGRDTTAAHCVADQGVLGRVPKGRVTVVPDRFILGPVEPEKVNVCPIWDFIQRLLAGLLLLPLLPLLLALKLGNRLETLEVAGRLRQEDLSGKQSFTTFRISVWKGKRGMARFLPALSNVLSGRLHLVGVEPLAAGKAQELLDTWQQPRFSRLPGVFSPWHATAYPYPYEFEKRAAEVYYAKTRTTAQDVMILAASLLNPNLFKTPPVESED